MFARHKKVLLLLRYYSWKDWQTMYLLDKTIHDTILNRGINNKRWCSLPKQYIPQISNTTLDSEFPLSSEAYRSRGLHFLRGQNTTANDAFLDLKSSKLLKYCFYFGYKYIKIIYVGNGNINTKMVPLFKNGSLIFTPISRFTRWVQKYSWARPSLHKIFYLDNNFYDLYNYFITKPSINNNNTLKSETQLYLLPWHK